MSASTHLDARSATSAPADEDDPGHAPSMPGVHARHQRAQGLSRRSLLSRGVAGLASLTSVAGVLGSTAGCSGTGRHGGPVALATDPADAWPSAFRPFAAPGFAEDGQLRSGPLQATGRLPAALRGTLYRNGPARMQRGEQRLSHWFDGDGMLQALRFDGEGRLHHHGRMIDTPKARAEAKAGQFRYGGFGSTVADPDPVSLADAMNPGNINLLPVGRQGTEGGQRLFALWEAGSAIEVDPGTLATRGLHTWSAETEHAPFGAHPRVAADGTIWNFGYLSGTGKLLIYQIAPNGRLQRQTVVSVPGADMVHDFAITERHLVFLLPPFRFERGEQPLPNLMAGMTWMADAPLRVAVVDMADWRTFITELPHGGVFHLGNAWEAGGLIHLGYARQPRMDRLIEALRPFQPAAPGDDSLTGAWTQVQIDPVRRTARQQQTDVRDVEFPRWDARRTGQRSRLTVMLQRSSAALDAITGFDSVLTLDDRGRTQRFSYGAQWVAEEHLLVPHPERPGEDAGWVVGTAYHWPSQRTTVSVFRAHRVADGPIAQVRLPYGLPLGLHGQFVAA